MCLIRQAVIVAILGTMFLGIAVNAQENSNSCLADGSSCGLDSQCCNGWCKSYQCTNPNVPEPQPNSCRSDGSSCSLDSQCCSGWCPSHKCTEKPTPSSCLAAGGFCNLDSECCSGWCPSHKCTEKPTPSSCQSDGSSCTLDSQCCSGSCKSSQCASQPGSKVFKIWVGDKDSKNLPGADVSVDGVSKGKTDAQGEVQTEVIFGKHTVSAQDSCGTISKDYDFSESIDGVTLSISTCPESVTPPVEEPKSGLFTIWVTDKDSNGVPNAEVYVDSNYLSTTDSNGYARGEIVFGMHTIEAKAPCGTDSDYLHFSSASCEPGDYIRLDILTCPGEAKKKKNDQPTPPITSKKFMIWVGDKNYKNLPNAVVYIDNVDKGTTNSKGELWTEVTFGEHHVSAIASCGVHGKDYTFSDKIQGVSLLLDSCG